jgi:hypothetical protein
MVSVEVEVDAAKCCTYWASILLSYAAVFSAAELWPVECPTVTVQCCGCFPATMTRV